MLPTGTWLISAIVETVQNFESDSSRSLHRRLSDRAGGGTGTGLFVAAEAKEPEGAITFIDYLLQDNTARLLTESC